MDWISDLFKYVTGSKIFTFALFVTSSALLFGNKYISTQIPLPQDNIKLALVGLCIFSGTVLAVSSFNFLWDLISSTTNSLKTKWKGATLSNDELSLIEAMGNFANEPINLSLIDFKNAPFTKLEILHIANSLREKGFAEEHVWDEAVVCLTPKGRKKALDLMQSKKSSSE